VNCIERESGGNILAGTGGSGLYRSTDDGNSWSYVGLMNTNIKSLLADVSGTIFVGTENSGIYRSTDSGTSWSFVGLPNTTITSMSGLTVTILAGTNNGVYKSSDNGISWAYAGLNGRNIQDLLIGPSGDIYVAIGGSGVYRSSNGGQPWTPLTSGLNHLDVTSLAIDNDGYLYAGTNGGGVYKSINLVVGVKDEIISVPKEFQLFQNYPNPFNPVTTITYQLPNQSYVSLKVFDVLGSEVAVLVNGVEEPGYKSVTFDASRLSSGVYYYRLQARDYIETKKLLLLR
jgi:photosystem II stability/assembly factor-like uncharacterized protein